MMLFQRIENSSEKSGSSFEKRTEEIIVLSVDLNAAICPFVRRKSKHVAILFVTKLPDVLDPSRLLEVNVVQVEEAGVVVGECILG